MDKRGISPLIVTVILVGTTMVLAILVLSFGVNVQKSMIKNSETDVQKLGLLNFKASYSDANCFVEGQNCYRLLIENKEEFSLNLIIITKTSLGSSVSNPNEYQLNGYEQNVFTISYPSSLGTENVQAEVKGVKS